MWLGRIEMCCVKYTLDVEDLVKKNPINFYIDYMLSDYILDNCVECNRFLKLISPKLYCYWMVLFYFLFSIHNKQEVWVC